jgi:DNA transformation protein
MPVSAAYKSFIQDLLSDFGPVSIRHMFSGAGVYADGVMFAILVEDTLYLKADEVSAPDVAAEGKGPFTYRPKGRGQVALSYWEVARRP